VKHRREAGEGKRRSTAAEADVVAAIGGPSRDGVIFLFDFQPGKGAEQFLDQPFIFFRFQAARRIDEGSAGPDGGERLAEQLRLAAGEGVQVLGAPAPAGFRTAV
jgi:hypothetical protein